MFSLSAAAKPKAPHAVSPSHSSQPDEGEEDNSNEGSSTNNSDSQTSADEMTSMLGALKVGDGQRALLAALIAGQRQLQQQMERLTASHTSPEGTPITTSTRFFTAPEFPRGSQEGVDPGSKDAAANMTEAERARLRLASDVKVLVDSTGMPTSNSIVRLIEATISHLKAFGSLPGGFASLYIPGAAQEMILRAIGVINKSRSGVDELPEIPRTTLQWLAVLIAYVGDLGERASFNLGSLLHCAARLNSTKLGTVGRLIC